jgi:hypothetical protein
MQLSKILFKRVTVRAVTMVTRSRVLLLCVLAFPIESSLTFAHSSPDSAVEKQRKQAEEQGHKKLDSDAISAVEETKKAMDALENKHDNEAISAFEQATGKLDILLARHPENALLPVDSDVNVVDSAPEEIRRIVEISNVAKNAIKIKNYPAARILLDSLRSEIHVRTYNLPLAIYTNALKKAAPLIDQNKLSEAKAFISAALNTLVMVDQTIPIPLIHVQIMLEEIEKGQNHKNREEPLQKIDHIEQNLSRAKELGYTSNEVMYANLVKDIKKLRKEIKNNIKNTSTLATIKKDLSGFLKIVSEEYK